MEPVDDPFVSSSSRDERVEAVDLLEECWFFGNLLGRRRRRRRMFRCYSDLCPSSNFNQEMLVQIPSLPACIGKEEEEEEDEEEEEEEEDEEDEENQTKESDCGLRELTQPPSPCIGRQELIQDIDNDPGTSKLTQRLSRHSLLRTPSLPSSIGRKELIQHKETDPGMSKLTRQASLNSPKELPPRHASEGMTPSSSFRRHRPQRTPQVESMNMDDSKEMRRRFFNEGKTRKSQSDLEFEEVQGFKDLGFIFDKEELSPSVVNILPGLQEKNRVDSDDDEVRRPYLSEAWLVQSSAPPIPNCFVKKSGEDMKAQIKFWARAVASNVRQEC